MIADLPSPSPTAFSRPYPPRPFSRLFCCLPLLRALGDPALPKGPCLYKCPLRAGLTPVQQTRWALCIYSDDAVIRFHAESAFSFGHGNGSIDRRDVQSPRGGRCQSKIDATHTSWVFRICSLLVRCARALFRPRLLLDRSPLPRLQPRPLP